ncbi:MAG TPA: hypothetical protein VIK05_01185, partial [Ilumatobacteraceae bacterium]
NQAMTADGIELGDLLRLLAGSPLDGFTLADLFPALFADADLPWQDIDLEATPLQNLGSPLVPPATFTTTITVANATPNVTVALTLPSGFAAVPGSANFDANGAAAPAPVALTLPAVTVAGATLNFNLGAVPPGTHTVTVQARAGIRTGVVDATVTGSATAGSTTKLSSASAQIEVVENPDSSFGPLTPDAVYVGHLVSAGDDDTYTTTFQVTPEQAAEGRKASVYLSNLAADYDLAVFGPVAAPLRGAPIDQIIPVDDHQIGVDPTSETVAPDSQFDIPLAAPAGSGLVGLSANRSNAAERVDIANLRAGTYTIQVSGYNGAFSDRPFTLRVRTQSLGLPPCTASAFGTKPTGSVAPTLPAGMDTLFVVPTNRLRQLWGDADATALMNRLQAFVTAQPGGVVAGILPVDAPYDTWDANRCSPDAANDVARQIATAIDAVQAANPTLQHIVLVGDDTALPFFRVSDGTSTANESNYAEGFSGNNRLVGSLARGYIQTDDPYGTARGIALSGRELFVPELAIGRLVESKADIVKALDTFTQFNGQLDPATTSSALVTGYDFLSDGATAVDDSLSNDGYVTNTLINETWTTADLTNAFVSADPDVASINAHFDHNRALPADQNAAGTQTDLFTTTDLPTDDRFANGLFLSMGCHGGLSVSDIELGVSADSVDWSQAFSGRGAQWIANTGFGYGDTELVAYSERLMALFAKDLAADGSLTTGQALSLAKRDYAKTTQVWSPYDEKALQEVVHYGLPMYRIAATAPSAPAALAALTAPTASADPGLPTTPDPITSVPAAAVNLDMTGVIRNDRGASGSFYSLDGNTLEVKDRPVEPLSVTDVHIAPADPAAGRQPHGALITALTSREVESSPGVTEQFTPFIDHPVIDRGGSEVLLDTTGDAIFPATLARATHSTDGSGNPVGTLLFSAGQFRPTGPGVGEQRLFDSATVHVLYGTGNDFLPPTISTTRGALIPAGATKTAGFDVDTDTTARRVVVLFKGQGDNVWRSVDLVDTDPRPDVAHWTGGAVVPSTLSVIEFFAQACDDNGNCSTTNNKASNFTTVQSALDADLRVDTAGTRVNGWFVTLPVQATIVGAVATCAIQFNLDGSGWVDYVAGAVIPISGEGIHILEARDDCSNHSIAVIPIDTRAPIVTAAAVPAAAPAWVSSASVTLHAIDPGGSGVASINYRVNQGAVQHATGESVVVPITTDGISTITYSATDAAGNTSADSTITVRVDTVAPTISASVTSGSLGNNGWYTTSPTVTISASDATSGVASIDWSTAPPASTTVPNSGNVNPFTTTVPITADGTTTVTYSATDLAGNRAADATITVKVDRTAPTFNCTADLTRWYGANQTATCTASDPVSGLATPASFTLSTAVAAGTETASALTNTAQLCDLAGNCTTAGPLTFKIDLKAPAVNCTPPSTSPWYAANVSVPCTAADSGSGLATTSPASFTLATSVAANIADAAASTSSRVITDVAGNSVTAGPFGPYKVDRVVPTITITTPAVGAFYALGAVVTPVFSCADVGSGIASCTASSPTIDTSTPGTRSFTVTAVDVAGNSATLTRSYTVGYNVCLQYDPNKANPLGGTMVIKFQLCNAAGQNLSSANITVTATLIDGTVTPPPNFQGASNFGNVFRFTSGMYVYNLDTSQLPTIGAGSHTIGFTV